MICNIALNLLSSRYRVIDFWMCPIHKSNPKATLLSYGEWKVGEVQIEDFIPGYRKCSTQ